MIDPAFFSAWVNAMGWTLLHSLWQITGIVLVVAVLIRLSSIQQAQFHYLMYLGAFASVFWMSSVTFIGYWETPITGAFISEDHTSIHQSMQEHTQGFFSSGSEASIPAEQALSLGSFRQILQKYTWIPVVFWGFGIVLLSLRQLGGWVHIWRLRRQGSILSGYWKQQMTRFQSELGIKGPIGLIASSRIHVPITFGWLKPVILFPAELLTGLSALQIEMLLLHEMVHIQRKDYLVNLGVLGVKILFFYHPGIYLLARWMDQSREACCDDKVMAMKADPDIYAETLIQLQRRQVSAALAMSATGSQHAFGKRIQRLFTPMATSASIGWSGVLLIGLMTLGMLMSFVPIQLDRLNTTEEIGETPTDSSSMEMLYPGIFQVSSWEKEPVVVYLITQEAGPAEWARLEADLKDQDLQFSIERRGDHTRVSFANLGEEGGVSGSYGSSGIAILFHYPERQPRGNVGISVSDNTHISNRVLTILPAGALVKNCIQKFEIGEVDEQPLPELPTYAFPFLRFQDRIRAAIGEDSILFVINGSQFLATDVVQARAASLISPEEIWHKSVLQGPNRILSDYDRMDVHTVFVVTTHAHKSAENLKATYLDAETGYLVNGIPLEKWGYTPEQFFEKYSFENFRDVAFSRGKTAAKNLGFPAKSSVMSIILQDDHPMLIKETPMIQHPVRLSVYPNPVQGKAIIDIDLSEDTRLEVRLLNLRGQLIWQSRQSDYRSGHYQIPIDMQVYPEGHYLVRVLTRNGSVQTLVKNVWN